ncbi:MAG TPA: hypothetical protein VFC73_07960 [Syntrophomonadaceae bacterium]|nr:hypothetical protein [Syntrophomonadaceae bacterium]
MDDLGKVLADTILSWLREIEEDTNLDVLIDFAEDDISLEAKLIKEKINSIKSVLETI